MVMRYFTPSFLSEMMNNFSPEIIPRLHGRQARAEADGQRGQGQAGVEQDGGCREAGEAEGDDGLS